MLSANKKIILLHILKIVRNRCLSGLLLTVLQNMTKSLFFLVVNVYFCSINMLTDNAI